MSGIEVCRQIRTSTSVPVIMVSAKTSEIDVVLGLEVGHVSLDPERHEVFVNRTPIRLPLKEFELLEIAHCSSTRGGS